MTEKTFKAFLSRKNFETLITSFSGYEKAQVVAPFLDGIDIIDENYMYFYVSKLLYDSSEQLSEDAIELLNLKHGKDKYLQIQTNECISEYLPQLKVFLTSSCAEGTEETVDAFEEVVKENDHLKRKIKKIYKKLKKYEAEEAAQEEEEQQQTTATEQECDELCPAEDIRNVFF